MKKKGIFSNLIDRLSLAVMSVLSGHIKNKLINEQYLTNKEAWHKYLKNTPAAGSINLIEDQTLLSEFRYGTNKGFIGKKLFNGKEMTGADNTCEVIALYNAMHFLEYQNFSAQKKSPEQSVPDSFKPSHHSFPQLLRLFSKKGISLRGMFGTNPNALYKYLLNHKYNVEKIKSSKINEKNCRSFEEKYPVYIFSTFNEGQNPWSMIHTMCITRDSLSASQKASYRIHNDYEGSKSYPTLYDAVTGYNNGKGHPIIIFGVSLPD